MRGLKTPESSQFKAFWTIVQNAAKQQGAVFFLDCGEGRDFKLDGTEGEDLRGWLIPFSQADAFEKEWREKDVGDFWYEYIAWAIWSMAQDTININFKHF